MGVIHKLRPEVKEFIIEKKRSDPSLSCRVITSLILEKFQLKLSKSSTNSILKQAGLSMPAGRRPSVTPVRCIKVSLLDGGSFYLDGQLHTVWRSSEIPEAFSSPIYNIKSYIESVFKKNLPWVLFFASGYDAPTEELFEFILSFDSPEKRILQLILYDNELRELETINAFAGDASPFSRHFVFGVWPWQFKEYIKVRLTTEFLPFKGDAEGDGSQREPSPSEREPSPAIGRNFYIAEAEVELVPPKKGDVVKLRGAALQKGTVLEENRPLLRPLLTILSNFTAQEINLNQLATLYLNHWPNLEETLRDFSSKIEQFRKRFL